MSAADRAPWRGAAPARLHRTYARSAGLSDADETLALLLNEGAVRYASARVLALFDPYLRRVTCAPPAAMSV